MFSFIFFANLHQKAYSTESLHLFSRGCFSPSLSSCDHIASQLSPEPAYTWHSWSLLPWSQISWSWFFFFTSLATASHSPSSLSHLHKCLWVQFMISSPFNSFSLGELLKPRFLKYHLCTHESSIYISTTLLPWTLIILPAWLTSLGCCGISKKCLIEM